MKRTWIKIKRGILEPKHRRQLGAAWFLYFYMLDITDWKDGVIYDWKDGDVAADLEIPVTTLRDHRRKLEDSLYIRTKIKQYGLEITVNNWTNPREYSGEVYNQVDENTAPQTVQVNTQVDTQVNEKLTPLHLTHISHDTYKPADEQVKDFLDYFMDKTNLEPINDKMFTSRWIKPLTDMLKKSGNDVSRSKKVLLEVIKDCDRTNYTFSTPYQIQSRFAGIAAKQGRKKPAGTEFDPSTI